MEEKEIKIRKKFPGDMDPSTKVHKVKTDYQRQNNKKTIEETLAQEELDSADLDWLG